MGSPMYDLMSKRYEAFVTARDNETREEESATPVVIRVKARQYIACTRRQPGHVVVSVNRSGRMWTSLAPVEGNMTDWQRTL